MGNFVKGIKSLFGDDPVPRPAATSSSPSAVAERQGGVSEADVTAARQGDAEAQARVDAAAAAPVTPVAASSPAVENQQSILNQAIQRVDAQTAHVRHVPRGRRLLLAATGSETGLSKTLG